MTVVLETDSADLDLEAHRHFPVFRGRTSAQFAQWLRQILAARQAVRREHAVLLAETLDRLPQDYREVLILRHLEECAFTAVPGAWADPGDRKEAVGPRAAALARRIEGDCISPTVNVFADTRVSPSVVAGSARRESLGIGQRRE
jgi:hypothetical protein